MRKHDCSFLMILILIVGLSSSTLALSQPTSVSTLPLEKRLFILSKTYAAIPLYFAHWQTTPEFSLDALYQEYLTKVLATEDRFQFDLIMMEFVARLNNGHSWYSDRWIRKFGQPLGFTIFYLDGKWVVAESWIEKVEPGDIISKIDGENFESFYQRQKKYINASSDRERRVKFPFRAFLFPEQFRLQLANGRQETINRKTQKIAWPPFKIIGRWIEKDKIAYLKIPSFDNPEFEEKALELVNEFREAEVLIVDVRGNGGGTTPEKLVKALQDRPFRFWAESTPISVGLFKAYSAIYQMFEAKLSKDYRTALKMINEFFAHSQLLWTSPYQQPENFFFLGKLIILTDRRCGSACEDFIVPFKDNKRAIIVGETTMGSSGQPYIYNFDDQISIAIGTKREYLPDGRPFEGRGIEPDVFVQPTIQDLKSGRDVVLEKALSLARDK